MTKAQRLQFIKEISSNLANSEWPNIDLILNVFEAPTSATWTGSKDEYVIHHIKDLKDSLLIELNDYIGGGRKGSIDEQDTDIFINSIWTSDRFRLFLSHLSTDKGVVTQLKDNLAAYGISGFVAHQDINPSHEWQAVIEAALQSCDALTAWLSDDFHASNWTDQEIGFAVSRKVLVVPLKLNINPYGFIGKYQALDCKKLSPAEIAAKIFDILIEHPSTSSKLSDSIVAHFAASSSFDSAKTRSLLLSKIKNWTPEMLRSIENSLATNSQIRQAFGVPSKIRSILEEYS